MISATKARDNFLALMKVSAAQSNTFEIYHFNKIFLVTIEPTNRTHIHTYKRKGKGKVNVHLNECKVCHSLLVSGICINKRCTTNQVNEIEGSSHNIG